LTRTQLLCSCARMSAAETAPNSKPNRFIGLLALVRQLIDYGRQLATTLRSNPHPLGAGDIAQILARITCGLLRAEALEARLIRNAARPEAAPAPPRAPSHRQSPPAGAAAQPTDATQSPLARMPTPEQIAAEVRRRRPIGAVIADICRDLGIMPSHPLWRELQLVIIRHGGNLARLVKDILDRTFPRAAVAWPAAPLQSPAASGAGPP
jgi:hypothetical protein